MHERRATLLTLLCRHRILNTNHAMRYTKIVDVVSSSCALSLFGLLPLLPIELLHDEMQKQVHIHSQITLEAFYSCASLTEEVHELGVVKLCLE